MLNKTSGNRTEKAFSIIVFFLCAIVFYMAYNFRDTSDNFDLPRYYSLMDLFFNGNESIGYVIASMYTFGNDFIYYVFLFLFNNTPLGREFVPGMFTAVYYFLLMKSFTKNVKNSSGLLLLLGLFAFPNIMYVITIARTTGALVFFFIGVLFHSNDKTVVSILFFVLAIMTHFSSIMFVLAFFLTLFLYRIWLKNKKETVNILCVVLPPIMFLLGLGLYNYISELSFLSYLDDTKYDRYVVSSGGADFSNFSWLYMLQFYLSLFVTYVLLIINKQSTSFSRILLMVCLSVTCGLMTASQNLFNRWFMLLPLLYSMQFAEIFVINRELIPLKKRKEIDSIGVIGSIMVLMVFMLMMYSSHSYLGL